MLDKRYNLIHAYFASADTARRAASLGAVVDTQPMWFYKDGDALLKALGPKGHEHLSSGSRRGRTTA